mmetsp:Transcript_9587/g.20788  ORF Transcript_9587/g.20788 Transcript_9587/m.20788 type:complete len:85 (-) Transcript_9587:1871-2125(-)
MVLHALPAILNECMKRANSVNLVHLQRFIACCPDTKAVFEAEDTFLSLLSLVLCDHQFTLVLILFCSLCCYFGAQQSVGLRTLC